MLYTIFHPKSKYSLLTVAMCWAIIAYLTGAVVGVLLALFILTLLLTSIKALVTRHGREHYVRNTVNEGLHISTYAITTSMLLLTVLPWIIPDGAYLDAYAMQIFLTVPTLLVFTFIIHYSHHKIVDGKVWWLQSLAVAVLKTVILTAVLIAGVAIATNMAADRLQGLQEDLLVEAQDFGEYPQNVPDLKVVEELATHYATQKQYAETVLADDCTLCRPSTLILGTARSVEALASMQFTAQILRSVAEEQSVIAEIPDALLEQQLFDARQRVAEGASAFVPPVPLIEENTTPRELWMQIRSEIDLPPQVETTLSLTFGEAPLHKSMERAVQHTLLWRSALNVLDRALTQRVLVYPPSMRILYENREVEESMQSKTIRFLILASWAENYE